MFDQKSLKKAAKIIDFRKNGKLLKKYGVKQLYEPWLEGLHPTMSREEHRTLEQGRYKIGDMYHLSDESFDYVIFCESVPCSQKGYLRFWKVPCDFVFKVLVLGGIPI